MMPSTSGPSRTSRPRRCEASIWNGWTRSSVVSSVAIYQSLRGADPEPGPRGRSGEAPGEDALLRVEAVLRLIPDHRLRSVDHAGADLLAALRREAVHEDRVGLGGGHQPLVDAVRRQDVVAVDAGFNPH